MGNCCMKHETRKHETIKQKPQQHHTSYSKQSAAFIPFTFTFTFTFTFKSARRHIRSYVIQYKS